MSCTQGVLVALTLAFVLVCPSVNAYGDEALNPKAPVLAAAAVAQAEDANVLKAFSLSLDYTLVTDYVWRGINLSEYAGEGREKLNHQLSVGVEFTPGEAGLPDIGTFGFNVWFEWYGGQEKLTPGSADNLQETDYTIYWSYDLSKICAVLPLDFETGWIGYNFPRLKGDAHFTNEWYFSLALQDEKVFGRSLLNPTVTYYMDLDDVQAGFLTLGISHDFPLAELGLQGCPVMKDVTVTPSLLLALDHRYYDKVGLGASTSTGTKLAYIEYGLAAAYDLSSALSIPEKYGAFGVTGFLNFSQSLHDQNAAVQDE
ncbi:hypothetical protein LCGC14_1643400, partial [marine sediment metagenome]